MKALRPIGHEETLSIVDHLDELRGRLFICLGALIVAFGICFWQNGVLLDVLNRALPHEAAVSNPQDLGAVPSQLVHERLGLNEIEKGADALAGSANLTVKERAAALLMAHGAQVMKNALPRKVVTKEQPITIGVGEPFTITLTVAAYFALLFTLPLIIYQGYAFVIPALTARERRVALPVMLAAPILFVAGALFAYLLVLPAAVHFLQGYNHDKFQILVQAKQYYTFQIFTMLGIGLAFQLPLGLLALQRLGVLNSQTLIHQWRYATVIIAVIGAAMPGADPVTTALETLPWFYFT